MEESYYQKNREKILAQVKANTASKRDGYFHVYYLPEEHYVGYTEDKFARMKSHKHAGRHVDDVEWLARFERQIDAHWFETLLHMRGYEGFHTGSKKN